jgi:hypothetical protein
MKTTYLDYYKTILDKVSFDRQLFRKEYRKALSRLQEPEQGTLNQWLRAKGLLKHEHHNLAEVS